MLHIKNNEIKSVLRTMIAGMKGTAAKINFLDRMETIPPYSGFAKEIKAIRREIEDNNE